VHNDDASTFSFADLQSQNSQGSAKLLQQLMGVRVFFLYACHLSRCFLDHF
jgi:hypothetical protein